MATKTVTMDDLDSNTEAAETLLYLLDGAYWEIDLSADNAAKFRNALTRFLKVSRPVAAKDAMRKVASSGNGNGSGTSYGEYDPAIVRAWCAENGVEVNDKGRVPEHIVGMWRRASQSQNATE